MSLSRVLLAFSKYDNTIGYVQGMNHIVDALSKHCSEEISFWLFVSLIEDYELRDIYMPGIPGLYKHIHVLTQLLEQHLPSLLAHLQQSNVDIELFASNWIFTLYTNSMPAESQHLFLTQFFEHGWPFFYRFTLTYLHMLASRILQIDESDSIEIIELLKNSMKPAVIETSPVSLLDSIGRMFTFGQTDSCVEVLGISYESFVAGQDWQLMIDASRKLYATKVTEKHVSLLFKQQLV